MRPKARRRHQVLELYQKAYAPKINHALKASEYDTLNEAAQCRDDDGEWIDDDDDEIKMKRLVNAKSQRMSVRRRVIQELWDVEDERVKETLREQALKEVVSVSPTADVGEDGEPLERTPEEYQR